jgi:hypothetical protein
LAPFFLFTIENIYRLLVFPWINLKIAFEFRKPQHGLRMGALFFNPEPASGLEVDEYLID